jgi:GTP1/Obg family GTP-binding protein
MFLPVISFTALIFAKKRNEKLNSNTLSYKMKQANKIANSRLKIANTHLQTNNFNDFYKEVLEALYGYLSYKFALPIAQLNKDNINNLLLNKGAEMPIIAKLNEVLNNCEFAQYAPAKDASAMKRDYDSAVEIIISVEEILKN